MLQMGWEYSSHEYLSRCVIHSYIQKTFINIIFVYDCEASVSVMEKLPNHTKLSLIKQQQQKRQKVRDSRL